MVAHPGVWWMRIPFLEKIIYRSGSAFIMKIIRRKPITAQDVVSTVWPVITTFWQRGFANGGDDIIFVVAAGKAAPTYVPCESSLAGCC